MQINSGHVLSVCSQSGGEEGATLLDSEVVSCLGFGAKVAELSGVQKVGPDASQFSNFQL